MNDTQDLRRYLNMIEMSIVEIAFDVLSRKGIRARDIEDFYADHIFMSRHQEASDKSEPPDGLPF